MLLPKKEDVMFTDSYTDYPRLLDITCFLFYTCSPIRKLTDPVLIQLLGEMLNLICMGLGYTLIPSSFIYDTMSLFHSLYGYGNLPSILSHESVPFQIRRLGQTVPGRMIHVVYSTSSPLARQLRTLSEQLVRPFSGSAVPVN
ncbi:hypothetical protein VK70_18190 [Paenibacillus durus ATCC 35681]|uniref:LysR substrate-binding domain-containing protein n=1 Tax=Paenibacillus durus ATCC 35681 TaxID=1333534 RepID=A0A0F7FCX8_PAEDU|nr:hypothetical protein VK70_18190 [Paenibacillus durus ATCC 35681]